MDAKIKKEFVLIVGTNDKNKTENDLIEKALELEQLGNQKLNVRFHIFVKEK